MNTYYTNHQSFGANLNINNLKYREYFRLGGKKRWMEVKNIFQELTKDNTNSYHLESHRNHQGLSTVEMYKKVGKQKVHVGGYGGSDYDELVKLSPSEIAGKLVNLIG